MEKQEKEIIDKLVDGYPLLCGLLDKKVIQNLFSRGLIYFDVPVNDDDYVYGEYVIVFHLYSFIFLVPTLDGFVMNRVQGDYFETLLYKVFVAMDGQMSVKEVMNIKIGNLLTLISS